MNILEIEPAVSDVRRPTRNKRPHGMSRGDLLEFIEARCTFEPNTGCWLWLGAATPTGYARMCWGTQKSGTVTRFILELLPGDKRVAMHVCDQPACVNPKHLRIATHAENSADMARKGRAASGPVALRKRRVTMLANLSVRHYRRKAVGQ